MKKKITLLLLFAITSISGWAQNSVSISSIPTSTPVAKTLAVNVSYSKTFSGVIQVAVNRYDGAASGSNWNNALYITSANSAILPAGSGTVTVNVPIPQGTTPTSELVNQHYKISSSSLDNSGNWVNGSSAYTVQHGYNFTPNAMSYSLPASTTVGGTLAVDVSYNKAISGVIQVVVNRYDGVASGSNWSNPLYIASTDSAILPVGSGTVTVNVPIPQGTTPTSELVNQHYKIEIKSLDNSAFFVDGSLFYVQHGYNFTPSLSNNDFDLDSNGLSVYPNPVDIVLNVSNSASLSNASFSIINTAGQTIKKSASLNNDGIDVSDLSSGLYILTVKSTEGIKTVKFQKK